VGESLSDIRDSMKDLVFGKKIRSFKVLLTTKLVMDDDDEDAAENIRRFWNYGASYRDSSWQHGRGQTPQRGCGGASGLPPSLQGGTAGGSGRWNNDRRGNRRFPYQKRGGSGKQHGN
jgi:hypothetical protein